MKAPAGAVAVGPVLHAWPGAAAAQAVPPSSSVKPPCPVSDDEKYACTREHPAQVGGSPVFGAARQRRYLDTLRRGLEPARHFEMPSVPAVPAEPVLVQVPPGFEGAAHRPSSVGGPIDLFRSAADAIARCRFEPARVNGAPVSGGVQAPVRFAPAK